MSFTVWCSGKPIATFDTIDEARVWTFLIHCVGPSFSNNIRHCNNGWWPTNHYLKERPNYGHDSDDRVLPWIRPFAVP